MMEAERIFESRTAGMSRLCGFVRLGGADAQAYES